MDDSEVIEELRKYNLSLRDELKEARNQRCKLEEELKRKIRTGTRDTILFLVILVASILIQSRVSYLHGYGNGSQAYKQKYCAVQYTQSVDYQKCLEGE